MVFVKGSSLKTSIARVKKMFGEEAFQKAIRSLSGDDKEILEGAILENDWIPLDTYVHWLEQEVKELLNGDEQQLVTFSEQGTEEHLSGVYKFFIRFGSPEFVMKRATTIIKQYFQGVECNLEIPRPSTAVIALTGLEQHHRLFEYVILGFCKKAGELSGAKNVRGEITTSVGTGSGQTVITIAWEDK